MIPVIEPTPEIRELIALAKVPILFAWRESEQIQCVVVNHQKGFWLGDLKRILPLLPNPTIAEVSQIFGDKFYTELKAAYQPQ